jgi:cytochrome c2
MWRQLRGVGSPDLNREEMAHILAFLHQAGTADPPGDAAAGAHVFADKGCSHCHSVRSAGGHSAPDLSAVAASGDSVVWMQSMWNHAQSMIEPIQKELGAWPQFRNREMNDLIAYITAGKTMERPASGNSKVLRGSAERGWQAFQAKCIQCHSVRGNGGRLGPELGPDYDLPSTTVQFATVLWNHAPAMVGQARESAVAAPAFHGEEIADLLQFLVSLQYFEPSGSAFLGERVFAERGCARCHGAKAEGTHEGPELRAGPEAFTTVSLATSLWRHGPAMRARAEELGIDWPTLEAKDIGDLIRFLNDPKSKE